MRCPLSSADHPDVLYVILGATHPDLLRREGEAYRTGLMARARSLGVADHVRFVDRFVGRVELTRWLEAADVFVTPYPNLDQIVSGTLSYAMGAGRAIVSTPYTYARELLADGRGVLVEPGSPDRFAEALDRVLRRRPVACRPWPPRLCPCPPDDLVGGRRAVRAPVRQGRRRRSEHGGAEHGADATGGRPCLSRAPLHPISRIHLDRLTDATGIREHAVGSEPDPTHGYCTDDVARALEVDLLHARTLAWPVVAGSAWRNLRFLVDAFDDLTGRFRNVRRSDGSWVPGPASDDSQGRAMLGLSAAIATAPDARLVAAATALFADALPQAQRVRAIRAQASVILACDAVHRANPTRETAAAHRLLATDLLRTFRAASRTTRPGRGQKPA